MSLKNILSFKKFYSYLFQFHFSKFSLTIALQLFDSYLFQFHFSKFSLTIALQLFDRLPEVLLLLFSCSVMSDSLRSHELQHVRHPCPSLSPRVCSNSCQLRWGFHPTIVPFITCFQSFAASGCLLMNQLYISGNQNVGASASASVLPVISQD